MPPKAHQWSGIDEGVVLNGCGAARLRVQGKDRKGLCVTLFHKGGGTREEAEKALMGLLDHHWPKGGSDSKNAGQDNGQRGIGLYTRGQRSGSTSCNVHKMCIDSAQQFLSGKDR